MLRFAVLTLICSGIISSGNARSTINEREDELAELLRRESALESVVAKLTADVEAKAANVQNDKTATEENAKAANAENDKTATGQKNKQDYLLDKLLTREGRLENLVEKLSVSIENKAPITDAPQTGAPTTNEAYKDVEADVDNLKDGKEKNDQDEGISQLVDLDSEHADGRLIKSDRGEDINDINVYAMKQLEFKPKNRKKETKKGAKTGPVTMREVQFTGGVAGASSVYSLPTYQPANAFMQGSSKEWHSGHDSTGKGELSQAFPHTIWYRFTNKFVPAGVSFRTRNDNCCGPTKFRFVGTNDKACGQYSNWTVLCQDLSGIPFKNAFESKYCDTDVKATDAYSCLGIMVLASSYTKTSQTSIVGIRMWARE